MSRLSDELAHANDELDSADVSYFLFGATFLSHSDEAIMVEVRRSGQLVGYAQRVSRR